MKYQTIGYHTVENRNNFDYIVDNVPFKCTKNNAWLSSGYYFWEHDLERAHLWGKMAYNHSGYIICKFKLTLENLFDLHGRRDHQNEYQALLETLKELNPNWNDKKIPVGYAIKILRELNNLQEGIFSFDSVRAADHPKPDYHKFVEGRKEQMDLNPRIQICLFEKTKLNLSEMNMVYSEQY